MKTSLILISARGSGRRQLLARGGGREPLFLAREPLLKARVDGARDGEPVEPPEHGAPRQEAFERPARADDRGPPGPAPHRRRAPLPDEERGGCAPAVGREVPPHEPDALVLVAVLAPEER